MPLPCPPVVPGLYDLAARLADYAAGTLPRDELGAWADRVLAADGLGVREDADDTPWHDAPDEERLFWRLLYLVESSALPDDALRPLVARVTACLASTASPADTLELLPLVVDQPRLCAIVERHLRGVISRTGFLAVLSNAGYPPHAKLWLRHAGAPALVELCARLDAADWATVARMLERPPAG